jgi:hypothetical protein
MSGGAVGRPTTAAFLLDRNTSPQPGGNLDALAIVMGDKDMLWETQYRMIFWTFDRQDAEGLTMQIVEYFGNLGADFMPVFLPNRTQIPLDRFALSELISKKRGKGSLLNTWLTSANGLVVDLHLGVPLADFPEVIQIGLEQEHLKKLSFDELLEMFMFGVKIFKPYYAWGCMNGEVNYSREYGERRASVNLAKIPAFIEWFNYFDQPMVERLGCINKLLVAPVYRVQQVENSGGAILVLQEEAFDFQNPVHLYRREAVEKYLEFERLHKVYPKY